MNELLKEIEEDIRRERLDRLWARFGRLVVIASVVVIIVTVGVVFMKNQKQNEAMDKTATFIRGIDRTAIEDFAGAIAVFDELSVDKKSPYYALAMLEKARAQAALKDIKAAQKTYETLAKEKTALAGLAAVLASGYSGKMVTVDKHNAFYHTQYEWSGWQLLEQGKRDEATVVFKAIKVDPQAPPSMRDRMSEVLKHIAPEPVAIMPAVVPVKDRQPSKTQGKTDG